MIAWKLMSFISFQLARRLLISAWTASESLLTTARVSKDSSSSMLLVGVRVLVWDPSSWSVCPLTTERNQSWDSLFTLLLRCQPLWLNLTTVFSQLTPFSSTLMLLFFSTMRPFMTYAGARWTLSVPLIPTSTVLYLRYGYLDSFGNCWI